LKDFIKLIFITQAIFFLIFSFFALHLFSLQNKSSVNSISLLKQKYSEFFKQGENFRLQGDYKESIKFFESSLAAAKKIENKTYKIESLLKLGLLYWNIGQLEKSLDFYKETLSLVNKINSKEKKQEILNCIEVYKLYRAGKEYRSQSQHQKSIESFNKAIALARKINSLEHEVKCLRQLSITYWELKNFQKFFSLNNKALKIAHSLNHNKELRRCLYNIGIFYYKLDNYSQALKHYEEALRITRDLKDIKDESKCLNNIGVIYNNIGDYEKALEYLTKALEIDRQLKDDAEISIDTNNIGVTFRKKGLLSNNKEDFYKALKYFENSLKLASKVKDKKTEIQALNNMGTVYTDLESYPEALKYFNLGLKKAEEIHDSEETGTILNNIGIVYSNQGNYELSTKYYQRAIDLALEIRGGQILWEAYLEMANAYKKQGKYQKALENYKKSISVIEDIRSKIKLEELKASYIGTDKRIEAFHNIIDLLVRLHQSNPDKTFNLQAFNYLERAKARAFLDSLEVSEVNVNQGVNYKLLNQEKKLMKKISELYKKLLALELGQEQRISLNDQLKSCEDSLETLKREIRTTSPAYADLNYPQIITFKEAQKNLLDRKTMFFEYCIGKENSYAFIITKKELKIFPLPSAKKIRTMVTNHLNTITDRENQDFSLGYELFSTLILPGLDKNIKKIIFIPDDILHFLPFETLLTHKKKKKWLIEDYIISYVPSISSFREIAQRKKLKKKSPQKDILAFGDPFYGIHETKNNKNDFFQSYYSSKAFNFFRLKYSGSEIDRIASLFKRTKINIFKRERATEKQLKALNLTDYKIIHFATHGLIDDKKPARSSIVLSLNHSTTEDGFLQMREIFNLKLNSDLVTLSACQTGLGQFIKGEGIEGLNRAFFYAGSSSVLISLWAVNDQAASQLMERFYIHLRSSESIMNALRKAQLEMIASDALSHPYYWAAFIVTGKADKVIFPSFLIKWALTFMLFLLIMAAGVIALIIFKKRFSSPSKKI